MNDSLPLFNLLCICAPVNDPCTKLCSMRARLTSIGSGTSVALATPPRPSFTTVVGLGLTLSNVYAIKVEAESDKGAKGAKGGADDPAENGDAAGVVGDDDSKGQEGAAPSEGIEQDGNEEDVDEAAAASMPIRKPLPPQDGSWASCIRLLDPAQGATVECLELGEGVFSFLFSHFLPFGEVLLLAKWMLSGRSSFLGSPLLP